MKLAILQTQGCLSQLGDGTALIVFEKGTFEILSGARMECPIKYL